MTGQDRALIDKIGQLSAQRPAQVEDFVGFLFARDDAWHLARAATRASEPGFAKVWDNDDDAVCDRMRAAVTLSTLALGDTVRVPLRRPIGTTVG